MKLRWLKLLDKMKKNIIIFLIIFFSFFSLGATYNLDFSIPVPEETELQDKKIMTLNQIPLESSFYFTKKSKEQIKQFYKEFFAKAGFSIEEKEALRFRKEDLVVVIHVKPYEEKLGLMIAKYLLPKGTKLPTLEEIKPKILDDFFSLPKEDQPGEDLAFVPRPPKSIRYGSLKLENKTHLVYNSSYSIEELRGFYKQKMFLEGFRLLNESAASSVLENMPKGIGSKNFTALEIPTSNRIDFNTALKEAYLLSFAGRQGEVNIFISPNFFDPKLGSIVQISYEKK